MQIELAEPEVRKLTIGDYYRMAEAGILRPSEQVELLNGRIIQMAPIGPKHQTVVDKLTEAFVEQSKGRYRVRVDGPISIPNFNEPRPDLTLYRRTLENKHPEPADIYLVIEVSDSSLTSDAAEKLGIYEQAGIQEYWIVQVAKKLVRIHTLKNGRYTQRTKSRGSIAPQLFSDARIQIESLF
jgi:Uma2 family endonuclease